MIKELTKLANHLDGKGYRKEADLLDRYITKFSYGLGEGAGGGDSVEGGDLISDFETEADLTPSTVSTLLDSDALPANVLDEVDFDYLKRAVEKNPRGAAETFILKYHGGKENASHSDNENLRLFFEEGERIISDEYSGEDAGGDLFDDLGSEDLLL